MEKASNSILKPQNSDKEIFEPNSWYGNSTIIKKYCGWPFALPFVLPHGIELSSNFIWQNEIENKLTAIWIFPSWRKKIYKKYAKLKYLKEGFSPWLILCKNKYSDSCRKGLLAMPAHSTHHISVNTCDRDYAKTLIKLKKIHGNVDVCLYWRDIELGRDKTFKKYGFNIVCAGHMFDKKFLKNLHKIFSKYTFMHTNEIGSHLFYAASSGCRVILSTKFKISYRGKKKIRKRDASEIDTKRKRQLINIFSSKKYSLQKTFSQKVLGIENLVSPQKLLFQIFFIAIKKNLLLKQIIPFFLKNKIKK